MGVIYLSDPLERPDVADVVGGGGLFTATIERHYGGVFEWRGMECARGVGDVVLDEVPLIWAVGFRAAKAFAKMMRSAAGHVAGRVDDRSEEERIPGGVPLLGDWMTARLE